MAVFFDFQLIVDVTDTNEFAPTANPEFPFNLPEGEPPGTVVGEITAIDPDSPDTPLIYIISDIQPPGKSKNDFSKKYATVPAVTPTPYHGFSTENAKRWLPCLTQFVALKGCKDEDGLAMFGLLL